MLIRKLRVVNLASSLTRYSAGLQLQDSIAEERKHGLAPDTLILLQHFPVYTLGKRGTAADFKRPREELESAGAEICVVARGGEVTYHGPGQLVAYPILGVRQAGLGARAYVESLEDSLVNCLAPYGIAARGRVPGATGVWVEGRKIAAIGVRISHGISSHGIALNVNPDLSYFDHIVPCGIPDKEVTSIHRELTRAAPPVQPPQRRTRLGAAEANRDGDGAGGGGGGGWAGRDGGDVNVGRGWDPSAGCLVAGGSAGVQAQGCAAGAAATRSVASRQPPEFNQVVADFVEAFRQRLGFAAAELCG